MPGLAVVMNEEERNGSLAPTTVESMFVGDVGDVVEGQRQRQRQRQRQSGNSPVKSSDSGGDRTVAVSAESGHDDGLHGRGSERFGDGDLPQEIMDFTCQDTDGTDTDECYSTPLKDGRASESAEETRIGRADTDAIDMDSPFMQILSTQSSQRQIARSKSVASKPETKPTDDNHVDGIEVMVQVGDDCSEQDGKDTTSDGCIDVSDNAYHKDDDLRRSEQRVRNSKDDVDDDDDDDDNQDPVRLSDTPNEWDRSDQSSGQQTALTDFMDTINQWRYICGAIVNNKHVQFCIIVLIAINAAIMGIATFDFVSNDPELDNAFELVDKVFLVIFTIELGLQFVFLGWRMLLDGWLVFDLVVIVTSWSFSQLQIIRAFRIFRALRLITRIKIMKNLVLALFGVMPRMGAIGLMLCLIFYIFAVMFTQLFKHLSRENKLDTDYFSRIDRTIFTLFQIMTLDNWSDIARQVIDEITWAWVPFIAFVIISGFIVVNLIIAVICDAISALHRDDKAKIHGTYDDNTESGQSHEDMEIREQLDCLEEQMEELTRIQARTFHTLQYLSRQVQMHKLRKEMSQKNLLQRRPSNVISE